MKFVFSILCMGVVLSGCSESNPAPAPAPAPTLQTVALSFGGAELDVNGALPVGKTIQFNASARFSDSSGQSVTTVATWQTANANIATVSAGGVVQGVAPGTVTITATYQGVSGSLTVTIAP